jgi:hypothetical protein
MTWHYDLIFAATVSFCELRLNPKPPAQSRKNQCAHRQLPLRKARCDDALDLLDQSFRQQVISDKIKLENAFGTALPPALAHRITRS